MRSNPFSLDFGGTPYLMIPRYIETDKVVSAFSDEIPTTHIFMITGARGNGKTVLMSAVKETLMRDEEWLHIDLSPESEMMNVMAASLYQKCKKKWAKWKVDLSIDLKVASIEASAETDNRYTSIYTDLDTMLEQVRDKKHKLLITVDEAVNTKTVREFTSFFQHCLREKYPVFLLMTGLYKNIRALQNDRSQTFLKRAPRIVLGPLSISRIAQNYEDVFEIDPKEAAKMAGYTLGYSYAFQILGYLVFEDKKQEVSDRVLREYKNILAECSYEKIWEELSANERNVAMAAAKASDNVTVKELREALDMNSNEFSTYSDTLEKSGVFASNTARGRIRFALPFIKEYIEGLDY